MNPRSAEELLAAWHAGTLDVEGCEALRDLLRENPELLQDLAKQVILERNLRSMRIFQGANLPDEVRNMLEEEEPDAELTEQVIARLESEGERPPVPTPITQALEEGSKTTTLRRRKRRIVRRKAPTMGWVPLAWQALAAVVIAGAVLTLAEIWLRKTKTPEPVVLETQPAPAPIRIPAPALPSSLTMDGPPEISSPPKLPPMPEHLGWAKIHGSGNGEVSLRKFFAGKGELSQGLMEVRLKNGVELRIEGPSEWKAESNSLISLTSGKIAAEVPPSAKGFTVRSNSLVAEDFGTRFAVTGNVRGDSALHVFDGAVEARVRNSGIKELLRGSETTLLKAGSSRLDEVDFDASMFARPPLWRGQVKDFKGVTYLEKHPSELLEYSLDKGTVYLVKERESIFSKEKVEVNLRTPGQKFSEANSKRQFVTTPSNKRLSVYLIHFSGKPGQEGDGWVRFDGPVRGVLCDTDLLAATDKTLGKLLALYPTEDWRGTEPGDEFEILGDGRTVKFHFSAQFVDHARILVLEDQ